jgi:iron complex outermembrane recepter protein
MRGQAAPDPSRLETLSSAPRREALAACRKSLNENQYSRLDRAARSRAGDRNCESTAADADCSIRSSALRKQERLSGRSFRTLAWACVLLLWKAVPLTAQTPQLAGVVRDTNGGGLPGVALVLTDSAGVTRRTVTSDEHGKYEVHGLPVGRYRLTATLSGFDSHISEVDIGTTTVAFDLILAVSSFTDLVTVTATKTGAADIQSTPIATTALVGKTIDQLGIQTVEDLAGIVPALTVTPSAGGHSLLTIRGVGTNSAVPGADPSSTVYLDGVYLGRAPMASLDFLNVDRVEVLRGPQGTLYGRNSVGGAVHIITQQPTDDLNGSLRLTAGNFAKLRAEGSVAGPLIPNRVLGGVSFFAGRREGLVEDRSQPEHRLGSEDSWAGRLQLRVVFNARTELLISGDYGRFLGVPLSFPKPIVPKPGFAFDNVADLWTVRTSDVTSGKNVQRGASARFVVELGNATTFTSLTAYRKSDSRLFLDTDATELAMVTAAVPDLQRQVSQELTIARRATKLTWIAGVFVFDDHNEGDIRVTLHPVGVYTRIYPQIDTSARALFGQATYDISKRVSLTAGARYTNEDKAFDNTGGSYRTGSFLLADPTSFYAYVDQVTSQAWTPRVSVQVEASPNTFAYVSATRGFKSGGFNTTARVRGKAFQPELAWTYEAGVKRTMAGGRLRTNTAVFFNDYRDLQVQSFIAPGQVDISNAGSATIKGVEFELGFATGGGLQLLGNATWLDAIYNRYVAGMPGGATLDAAGKRLNNAPEWSGNLSALYEFAAARAGRASMRIDVPWQNRVFFTPANDSIETQGPYGLVNLRAGLEARSRRWEIAVYARNVANHENITGTTNVAPTAFTAHPGEPRQWGTQFTIRR